MLAPETIWTALTLLTALVVSIGVNVVLVSLMRLSGPIVVKQELEAMRAAIRNVEADVGRVAREWAEQEGVFERLAQEARDEFERAERKRRSAAAAASRANGVHQQQDEQQAPRAPGFDWS